MKKILTIIILAAALAFRAGAQVADSTFLREPVKSSDFKATQLIAPGALLATGAVMHFAAHEATDVKINEWTSTWRGDKSKTYAEDYLRFVPMVAHLGLGLLGAEAEHGLWDRAVETGWAWGTAIVLNYSIKAMVNSPRPDGADNNSFPSGHTAWAFSGAELVRMEYGWGWGAGAYAVATGVAFLRLYNNDHWASDILFGAGLGILTAHIGGWMLKPTNKLLKIDHSKMHLAAAVDPVSGAVCPTLAFRF